MKLNIFKVGNAVAALSLVVLLGGCSKDFLNDPKPATSISATDVYASQEGVRAYFNGLYRELRTQWGSSTDAWGITAVNLAREVKGMDVSLPDGNWYNFDYEHDNREPNYRRTVFTWEFFYNFINKINNLIDGVENSQLPDAIKNELLAEGRAFRAWCYFELAREFAPAYSVNPDGPGLPIYLAPTTAETEGQPRQSLSAVYEQILNDLTYAEQYIPTVRANDGLKDVINKNVVNGLLARVYLEMGTYNNNAQYLTKAVEAATAARNGFALNNSIHATPITTDFASKSEVIWGFPQAADQTIYYGSPSAFFGTSGTGYFNFFVDSNFVNLFSTSDVRRAMFVNPAGSSFTGLRKWKTNKFKATTDFVDFLPVMRTPEMILIEAEAKARMGQADAATVLYDFQKFRDPSAVASGNTGEALIDEILLEKRKELFGEIGIGFLDVKRAGKPLVRSNGHIAANAFTIPANSPRFTLKIPQKEFDSNPQMDEATDQNP